MFKEMVFIQQEVGEIWLNVIIGAHVSVLLMATDVWVRQKKDIHNL